MRSNKLVLVAVVVVAMTTAVMAASESMDAAEFKRVATPIWADIQTYQSGGDEAATAGLSAYSQCNKWVKKDLNTFTTAQYAFFMTCQGIVSKSAYSCGALNAAITGCPGHKCNSELDAALGKSVGDHIISAARTAHKQYKCSSLLSLSSASRAVQKLKARVSAGQQASHRASATIVIRRFGTSAHYMPSPPLTFQMEHTFELRKFPTVGRRLLSIEHVNSALKAHNSKDHGTAFNHYQQELSSGGITSNQKAWLLVQLGYMHTKGEAPSGTDLVKGCNHFHDALQLKPISREIGEMALSNYQECVKQGV